MYYKLNACDLYNILYCTTENVLNDNKVAFQLSSKKVHNAFMF